MTTFWSLFDDFLHSRTDPPYYWFYLLLEKTHEKSWKKHEKWHKKHEKVTKKCVSRGRIYGNVLQKTRFFDTKMTTFWSLFCTLGPTPLLLILPTFVKKHTKNHQKITKKSPKNHSLFRFRGREISYVLHFCTFSCHFFVTFLVEWKNTLYYWFYLFSDEKSRKKHEKSRLFSLFWHQENPLILTWKPAHSDSTRFLCFLKNHEIFISKTWKTPSFAMEIARIFHFFGPPPDHDFWGSAGSLFEGGSLVRPFSRPGRSKKPSKNRCPRRSRSRCPCTNSN